MSWQEKSPPHLRADTEYREVPEQISESLERKVSINWNTEMNFVRIIDLQITTIY